MKLRVQLISKETFLEIYLHSQVTQLILKCLRGLPEESNKTVN